MRLDDRERLSCGKEVEVSSPSPFIRTGGKFWLCLREMTACLLFLWLNKTRLSLPHFSITVRSLERREKLTRPLWLASRAFPVYMEELMTGNAFCYKIGHPWLLDYANFGYR